MFAIRRAATRALFSPSLTTSHIRSSQSIRTYSLLLSRCQPASQSISSTLNWQRRYASDEQIPAEKTAAPSNAAVEQGVEKTKEILEQDGIPEYAQDVTPAAQGMLNAAEGNTAELKKDLPRYPDEETADSTTVFCGNLFYHVNEAQLKDELSKYGDVLETWLVRDNRGLSRGFGFVKFVDRESALRARETAHNSTFEGRLLAVQLAKERIKRSGPSAAAVNGEKKPTNTPSRTLWIGNMSYDLTDTDLNALFRPLKNVLDVRVAIDRKTGQARGFAHADFMDVESATEAFKQLDGQTIYGRRLRVDYGHTYAPERKNLGRQDAEPRDQTAPAEPQQDAL